MTMPRGASRALFAGNGQAVEFPFFFKVFEEDQLSVLITSPAGVTTEAAGWTAELDEGGGTLTYLHNGAPLPEGWKLAIMRDMPFVQEVDLITGTRFDPEVIETALDVATAERQQLLERLSRAVVVEPTDEAGPEALLADIRDARASAQASAGSAQANANAAAGSAQSAAGSAAIATEAREAACGCAQEARAARDVAIAQAEAANTLMETELGKVNAIVAANRTDQLAAVTAAQAWAEKEADTPVDYDEDGNPRYSARHWAENAQKIATDVLAVNPDGVTTMVNEAGLLSALGGNLLLNDETWITESGTWEAPVAGWYDVTLIGGGSGGMYSNLYASAGDSGEILRKLLYFEAGEDVIVTIGAGGQVTKTDFEAARKGGDTIFGDLIAYGGKGIKAATDVWRSRYNSGSVGGAQLVGAGYGGGYATMSPVGSVGADYHMPDDDGRYYGAGGGAAAQIGTSGVTHAGLGRGAPGAVILRWHDPAKAAGPLPAPAMFRMTRRAAPVSVNLYDPETGQGSVWREDDAEAKLAEGMISEEAWLAICAQRAAEARAAWLSDPDTEGERFTMLRAARDARLAATDYLVAPDYPLIEAQRAAIVTYRQNLRDLPAQEGAPWDGGGDGTPWPEIPLPETRAEGEAPCA